MFVVVSDYYSIEGDGYGVNVVLSGAYDTRIGAENRVLELKKELGIEDDSVKIIEVDVNTAIEEWTYSYIE